MKSAKLRSWLVILGVSAATAAFGALVPRIVIDNDIKNYFPHEHPAYLRNEAMGETYGSQMLMDIAIETSDATILTADTIQAVSRLTEALERLPGVERVQSLTNIDFIAGVDGGLSAERLVPADFDASPGALAALRGRIVEWKAMYDRVIVSDDFKGTQIIVSVERNYPTKDVSVLYAAVMDLIRPYQGKNLTFRVAGDPVIFELARSYMLTDLARLVPLVTVVVLLCLFFSFKNLEGTLLPLITVVFSAIWTIGLMALTGSRFTVVSSCLPIVLIAVGSAYGIHVVNHYYEDLRRRTGELTRKTHTELVAESLKKVIVPVMLAGITTVAGFISNVASPVVPLKGFSIFSALGVVFSLVMSVVLIPALLTVKPRLPSTKGSMNEAGEVVAAEGNSGKFFAVLFRFARRRRKLHVAAYAAVLAISLVGFSRLDIESSLITFFDAEGSFRRDVAAIDERFSGTNALSLLVRGPEKGDLTDPAVLSAMDDLTDYLKRRHPEIGKTISFTDFVRRMNRVLHVPSDTAVAATEASTGESVDSFFSDDGAAEPETVVSGQPSDGSDSLNRTYTAAELLDLFRVAYSKIDGGKADVSSLMTAVERELNYRGAAYDEIPADPAKYPVSDAAELKNLVSQYLLLYSGSLDQFANDSLQPSEARIQVQLTSHSTRVTQAVIADAEAYAAERFPEGYTLEASGIAQLEVALSDMIVSSQVSSVLIAAAAVFVILWISFRSVWAGAIGAVPLLLSILINFGIMGFLGINLDMVTSLISSIAIGIGIDYTIHFLNNYHMERLKSDDLDAVTLATLRVSGKGILVNAVSVGLGFLVLILSNFVVLRYIGFLVAVIMATSSIPAMTLLPLILNTFKPAFISRPAKEK
jgi:hypothetical protein